jgi:hypothetical protein
MKLAGGCATGQTPLVFRPKLFDKMFRFTQLNQKLRALLVAALVVVAVVTANGIQTAFVALTQTSSEYSRDARQALLTADFEFRGIAVGQERASASLGMTGMRERARLLGGTLLLSNNCASGSSGTIVQLQFPWLQEEVA